MPDILEVLSSLAYVDTRQNDVHERHDSLESPGVEVPEHGEGEGGFAQDGRHEEAGEDEEPVRQSRGDNEDNSHVDSNKSKRE